MGKIKRYKNGVEAFLSGEKGQRFFNFAYSIGAAVVIWGALFKILHLPGGNALLSIGMGTEVLMFVLTAFDRPPREYHWEEVFEVFNTKNPEDVLISRAETVSTALSLSAEVRWLAARLQMQRAWLELLLLAATLPTCRA